MAAKELHVTSHIARDLLQSAALFKHEWLVVWEYVSNGLQYVDKGIDPIVNVTVDSQGKKITITDNGRGMEWNDLANYFVMHGENIDRKQGQPGRGMFGTGKSAAFGIAGTLRVSTTRNGKLSVVELSRSDIEKVKSGDQIPIRTLQRENHIDAPNGTIIEIEDIYLKSIDQGQIRKFIERHIAKWPRATVYVNKRLCEYDAPAVADEYHFRTADGPFADELGLTELTVKVAKAPLEEVQQGVSIFSRGIWYETTLAGSERREMAQYLFGELDVPALADDKSPISAFDHSRSMTLNRSNPLVQKILGFIGTHVEQVRRKLVEEEKRRRETEDARRLEREADEIAKIINADFDAYRAQLARAISRAQGGKDHVPATTTYNGEVSTLIFGTDVPAKETDKINPGHHDGDGGGGGGEPPIVESSLQAADENDATTKANIVPRKPKPTTKGGFSVEFRNLGEDENRAKYEREGRIIFINLDHPQLSEALRGVGIEDITFKRLSYEVAFTEYSIALTSEMAQAGHFIDFFEPLTVTRETLNRVARTAAALYRAPTP